MADSYSTSMHELDGDDVHRLLPREILEDIGVVIDDPAERQVPDDDVIDDLAARLASVLGGVPMAKTPCRLSSPQGTVRRVVAAVPPPFLPSPPAVVPWQVVEGLMRRNSTVVIHPTQTNPTIMPGSTPAWPPLAGGARPTAAPPRRGTGTGVFFPRTEVVRRAAKAARSLPSAGNGNGRHARVIHQRGHQAAVMIVRTPQEMRAVAAHPELALPQEMQMQMA